MKEAPMSETIQNIIETKFSEKNWLTSEDLAQVFECDKKSINTWIKSTFKLDEGKRPPKFKLGKEYRFPKNEFITWLVAHQKG